MAEIMDDALFHRDGELFVPTDYAQGPWDPGAQFGGAPAALLATLVELVPTLVPMQIARLTVDLLRPVPLAPLRADVQVVREGKRIQVVAASLLSGDQEVVRSTALRMRLSDLGEREIPDGLSPHPLPDGPRAVEDEPFPVNPPGSRRAVEYLFEGVGGHFRYPSWVRLRVGVLDDEPINPVARLMYVADLASGIGQPPGLPVIGINADVAVNVIRYPEGEWLCLDGKGWISQAGVGQVQATLLDTTGVAGAVSMARLVEPIVP
jgi:Thioesterase-like superfamily